MQSMSTLFPSSELDRKLSEATSNEVGMPSSGLLYELGRACHRDDDYRIVTSAIWQTVLRSNQRPRVVLKTLMVRPRRPPPPTPPHLSIFAAPPPPLAPRVTPPPRPCKYFDLQLQPQWFCCILS